MSFLLSFCTTLVVLMCGFCILNYMEQRAGTRSTKRTQDQLNRIEERFHEMVEMQEKLQRRIDQLSTDVLNREIYQNANDRHQTAINDAKAGRNIAELMARNGLSSDEAALIIALHGGDNRSSLNKPANANLGKLSQVDLR